MKFNRIITIFAVFALLAMTIPITVHGDSGLGTEVTSEISITDSRGTTTNLTQPSTHVAAFSAYITNTLVDIGNLSNAVIFDYYSAYAQSGITEVQNHSADSFITVNTANSDMVVQRMLGMVDNGTWNKTNDVILGSGYSYLSSVWTDLENEGFKVITFYPKTYDDIVQVVEDIETVLGANHSVSNQMEYVKTFINEVLTENGIINSTDKVTAVYVSWSGSNFKLGNTGAVTTDFINITGGVNIAEDSSKATPSYTADATAILQLNPDFVLLDGNYPNTAEYFSSDVLINSDATVCKLNKSMNSYCPDAMTGLWTIACLFYPEYFNGTIPIEVTDNGEDSNDMAIYAVIGICIVVAAVALVVITKRKGGKD